MTETCSKVENAAFCDSVNGTVTETLHFMFPPCFRKTETCDFVLCKELSREISLTPSLSKVAEDFVVSDYIRPALERIADSNQFGTVSGSSTVLALLSMIHEWLLATDGNSASVRVFLFDYHKAFDFIDHGTLAAKLKEVEVPNSIVNWILDFLSDRSQRVKLSRDCLSEWGADTSRCPPRD